MTSTLPDGVLRFDRFVVQTRQRVLLHDGEIVRLPPKAFDLLALLVARANEVVPKSELVDRIWPDTFVSDANLSKLVFVIRDKLGDAPDGRPYIETIPKRGYRFIGTLGEPQQEPQAIVEQAVDTPVPRKRPVWMIAAIAVVVLIAAGAAALFWRQRKPARTGPTYLTVMPFTAATSGDEPLARGITEFVTARLATIHGLSVMPSTMAKGNTRNDSRKVARQLGAGLILEGTVQRNGDRIGIACRVTPVDERLPIRGSFIVTSSDIFELEERVAGGVAMLLELTQSLRRNSDPALATPESQQAYVRAVGLLAGREASNITEAISILERLSGRGAPRSALVLSALGRAHLLRFTLADDRSELETAERFAAQASALGGGEARVHALRGAIARARGDHKAAVAELQSALALEPDANDVLLELASVYNAAGLAQQAEKTYERVIRIHPMCALCFHSYGQFYKSIGRFDQAVAMHKKAIALDPDSSKFRSDLGAALMLGGWFHEAAQVLEQALTISRNNEALSNLGYCEYLDGDLESAVRYWAEAAESVPNDYLAWGNLGDALRLLPGRKREADEAFGKAIALARESLQVNPTEGRVRANLGEYLAKRGDPAAAEREIAATLAAGESQPDISDILFSAAAVAAANGRKREAVDYLQRAAKAGMSPTLFTADPQFGTLRSEPEFRAMRAPQPAALTAAR